MNSELEMSEANGAALVDTQASLTLPLNLPVSVTSQGPPQQSQQLQSQTQGQQQPQQPQAQSSQPPTPASPNSSAKKANKKRKLDELSLENISDSECPSKASHIIHII